MTMKKIYFWLLSGLCVTSFAFTACNSDDDDNGGNGKVETPDPVNYDQTGGEGTVTVNGGSSIDVSFPKMEEGEIGGVSIVGDYLSLQYYDDSVVDDVEYYSNFSLNIADYSPNTSPYEGDGVYLYISKGWYKQEGGSYTSDYTSISSVFSGSRAEASGTRVTVVQQSDGSFKFKIEGDVSVSTKENPNNNSEVNATINLEIAMPLAMNAEVKTNVTSKESSYPSFMPWLSGKKVDGVLQFTQSQLVGSGVLLWYYDQSLGYSDYQNLKEQAVKALGQPVDCYDPSTGQGDASEWTDIAVAYFYKDNKFIMVSYCPWREDNGEGQNFMPVDWNALMENHAARIQVHALEGLNFDYKELIQIHWR